MQYACGRRNRLGIPFAFKLGEPLWGQAQMASMHDFLDALGLAKYTQLFLDNDVDDLETLRALTERKHMQAADVSMSGTHICARFLQRCL